MNSSSTYFSNFDESQNVFNKDKPREFNKLIDDPCDIKQRNYSNDQKLKFVTTSFSDLINAQSKKNYFGINVENQLFVPSELMDDNSKLRYGVNGNILTNCNVKNTLGELPLSTMPARYQLSHGDIEIEDNMRNFMDSNKSSCNPKDTEYYKRSFYIFEGIEIPDATKSIETDLRCGVSTRYPNGLKVGKNYKK